MSRGAPSWLADFQERFGATIRTPLDRTSGTLVATTSAYDPELVGDVLPGASTTAHERLAVYHRQYWFRLLGVLQSAFPLTAQLMGYWSFNELAAQHLVKRPPRGWDVEQAADGFEAFFEGAVDGEPAMREALVESVRIDAAYRDVFRAPLVAAYAPSASDASRLLAGQLVAAPALRLVEEHRALVALRGTLLEVKRDGAIAIALPALLAQPRAWAIHRRDHGTACLALDPREAELMALLGRLSVGDALAELEGNCLPAERARLPEQARLWLAHSVERGFWCGLRHAL